MLTLVRHVCNLKPKGTVAPLALQRGQATLPNLQIVLRTLEFSHGLYREVVLTSLPHLAATLVHPY